MAKIFAGKIYHETGKFYQLDQLYHFSGKKGEILWYFVEPGKRGENYRKGLLLKYTLQIQIGVLTKLHKLEPYEKLVTGIM